MQESAAPQNTRVGVLLPYPLTGPFDYAVPAGLDLAPGDYVEVPLGNRNVVGVVWRRGAGDSGPAKLKPVARRFDVPPCPEPLRRLVDWIADYTCSNAGSVLRLLLRSPDAMLPPPAQQLYRAAAPASARLTPQRRAVLDVLADGLARSAAEIAALASVRPATVAAMARLDLIAAESRIVEPSYPVPDLSLARALLSDEQCTAAAALTQRVRDRRFSTALLQGVTGSGKTEVYFEAVAAALSSGRQVLILVPEIALTVQFIERFERRFGVAPAEWHSDISSKERRRVWRAAALGRAPVVVGARSALFLPFPDLGLIVVDEEHDAAFKQEDGVIYHARDMAVVRARLEGIPIVLSSATPSLETRVNAERGRYAQLDLVSRHGAAGLPAIEAVDMRRQRLGRGRFISEILAAALDQTLARGEQAVLFLNRRGYAPLTLCRACGFRLGCPDCTAWLTEHRFEQRLVCHHCGYSRPLPSTCPQCDTAGAFVACGPGIERLAEEAAELAPNARIALFSSDQSLIPREARRIVGEFEAGAIDLLIGTQIIAKGHHFPKLSLVGVVDGDLGLSGGDLRAGERTYQLLSQVAGRAGRADHPGRVLIQTYDPDHPVMKALISGDAGAFYAAEKHERELAAMPPFGRLAALILSGPDQALVESTGRRLALEAPRGPDLRVLGPAPAPLAVLRGRHRIRLLLKTRREIDISRMLRDWLERVAVDRRVHLTIDVDPQSFL